MFFNKLADRHQHPLIGGTVVAIHFADVFAVSDLFGEGRRRVADRGGYRISGMDQTGIVHEAVFRGFVFAEPEGKDAAVLGEVGLRAFPESVGTAESSDTEKVVMLLRQCAFAPAGFDGRLCQDNDGIDPETFSRLPGGRMILFDEFFFLHNLLFYYRTVVFATVASRGAAVAAGNEIFLETGIADGIRQHRAGIENDMGTVEHRGIEILFRRGPLATGNHTEAAEITQVDRFAIGQRFIHDGQQAVEYQQNVTTTGGTVFADTTANTVQIHFLGDTGLCIVKFGSFGRIFAHVFPFNKSEL